MNINKLTLGQIKEIKSLLSLGSIYDDKPESPFIGEIVLVRTYSAGVHIGTLENKEGTNVLLSSAHRIWKWSDAFTLSEVATKGIGPESRVSCKVDFIELTQAVEIIPVSAAAFETVLKNVE